MKNNILIHLKGAAAKFGTVAYLLATNAVGPLIFGKDSYGAAVALAICPNIIQGIIEPPFFALLIKSIGRDDGRVTAVNRGDVLKTFLIYSLVGTPLVLIIVLPQLWPLQEDGMLNMAIIVSLHLVKMVMTVFVGCAYAFFWFRSLVVSLLAASVVFVLAGLLFKDLGTSGFLLSLLISQLAQVLVFIIRSPYRSKVRELFSGILRKCQMISIGAILVPLYPRLACILLNLGTVYAAGLMLSDGEVATYKLLLTMVAAGAYVLPLSPYVLQSVIVRDSSGAKSSESKQHFLLVGGLFVGSLLISLVMSFCADFILTVLLGQEYIPVEFGNIVFWGMPFYIFIQPFGAMAYAIGRLRGLKVAFWLSAISLVLFSTFIAITVGFSVGAGTYIAVVGFVAWMKKESTQVAT